MEDDIHVITLVRARGHTGRRDEARDKGEARLTPFSVVFSFVLFGGFLSQVLTM
jgi:hypothetical protein